MSYLVMRTSTVVKYLTFISTLMLLNACGGGGSSAVPSPTVSIGASGSSIGLQPLLSLVQPLMTGQVLNPLVAQRH